MNPPSNIVFPRQEPTNYVKWIIGILVVIGIYVLVQPYFPLLGKLANIARISFNYVLNKTNDLGTTGEASIGSKLTLNKLSKPAPESYCYVGEWKGTRQCVQVDKSQCSSETYSTESQCVNPTLKPTNI